MKQKLFTLLILCVFSTTVFAGGIVTNANQSAQYVRMLARDASTNIDAVYYNPAGLTKLADGFHISISNQSLFQRKTIENKFPLLKESKYVGDVVVPAFPDFYAVYKKNKIALSFGFQPNAGGGSAKYDTGLPSFEIPVSAIPTSLSLNNIPTTNYSADINFEGSSVFWGAQVNASYAINDMISVSLGARMIFAKNTYDGYLKNIMINPDIPATINSPALQTKYAGAMVSATEFFTDIATYLGGVSTQLGGLSTYIQTYSTGDGSELLSDGASYGIGDQLATIQGTITSLGGNPSTMTIFQAQQFLAGASNNYGNQSTTMAANATATADKDVDAEQTGTGYTPIIGANFTFGEKLNIGLKYEFRTKLTLKNKTKVDGTGMFPDEAEFRSDIPAILSIGIGYKVLPQLRISAGAHYYFDKEATIESAPGKKKEIDGNLYEIALGGEYDITDKILISAGYLYTKTGVGTGYQTDLSHSLTSSTVGFGGAFKATEKMTVNLGMLYTMYTSDAKNIDYSAYGIPTAKETYNRTNLGFAIGIDYHF